MLSVFEPGMNKITQILPKCMKHRFNKTSSKFFRKYNNRSPGGGVLPKFYGKGVPHGPQKYDPVPHRE